ncbi:MAG: SGNH/GDSL hydrolase family protein [Nevskiaceae bacterium]|nr:MAG: SGNH/GDSL hydrolase family protein [Nevskiaceae bacterium]TBR71379.1 MAG: SGNH/GDSL hydrolase family protein [Nevskiaceae bacterium]
MNHKLAAIAFAPLLLAQGRHVRRVTPRLPEAAGARHGTIGTGKPLRLLIVGDSSAAGVGVATQDAALSGQLVARLAPHFELTWRLIATTGHTARDTLAAVECTDAEAFDIAVLAVGVNDVTGGTALKRWRTDLSDLCTTLESRFGVRRILLTPVPPMQAFPALPQPLRWYLGQAAVSLNRALLQLTASHPHWECVNPHFPLTPAFMAADGFHPGAAAYALWAQAMATAIQQG